MSIAVFIILQDLQKMETNYVTSRSFKLYFDWQELHKDNKKNYEFLYNVLPEKLFDMCKKTFFKHFNQ